MLSDAVYCSSYFKKSSRKNDRLKNTITFKAEYK